MKWYLLVLTFYVSFWGFLGWAIRANVGYLMLLLSYVLIAALVIIFNFKNKLVKEALLLLNLPCMLIYGIIKHLDSMATWRIACIIFAALLQGVLVYSYVKAKRKRVV